MTHRFIFAIAALLALSTTTYAADDFGPRFANESPAGFGNPTTQTDAIAATSEDSVDEFMGDMNDIANQLQNIMPAAGEETLEESAPENILNTP